MAAYFHFTLGPVQAFVAQARRTRDFWAGSFLLSWLSAVAMRAVKAQGGKILFPKPDDNYLRWLEGKGSGKPPRQGSVPNRFKAEVGPDFQPQLVEDSIRIAWRELARLVWDKDLEGPAMSNSQGDTRVIWERQVEHFWEIGWALSDDPGDSSLLDRAKNWRTHLPPDEPGVKCMMMDGWQELSGIKTPHTKGLNPFWGTLRKVGQKGIASDLREGEHLCAVAYIKRRFARYFSELDALMPGGWTLKGWELKSGVPSVSYMAAVRWLARANQPQYEEYIKAFYDAAYELTKSHGEWETDIKCIREANVQRQWKALDGNVFFDSLLDNPKLWDRPGQLATVKQCLAKWRKAAKLAPVTPFYAVLLMDGDSLGAHMSDTDKQDKITAALAEFTSGVDKFVYDNNGFLIYAGGDDVLAILPMEDALACAWQLHEHYKRCFSSTGIPSTLSGAIEYAHIKMPLGKVLKDAHDLLDSVAKEAVGRDAIACRVWKPGGRALEWAMPWEKAVANDNVEIQRIADEFNTQDEEGELLSSKFFYSIRERFELLNPESHDQKSLLNDEQAVSLMAMEYLNSRVNRKNLNMELAREKIRPLLEQCRPIRRHIEGDQIKYIPSTLLEANGALLVRFLAHKGVE